MTVSPVVTVCDLQPSGHRMWIGPVVTVTVSPVGLKEASLGMNIRPQPAIWARSTDDPWYITPSQLWRSHQSETQPNSFFMLHVPLRTGKMKQNKLDRQKSGRNADPWQKAKHGNWYSDLLQDYKERIFDSSKILAEGTSPVGGEEMLVKLERNNFLRDARPNVQTNRTTVLWAMQ